MQRPRVTIHNTVSVDGQLTGFPVDLGLHYEIAGGMPQDAVLVGSGTLLAAAAEQAVDLSQEDPEEPEPVIAPDDPRPWLVVVDSAGRLTRLRWLRDQPHWRDVLVLCSATTPAAHLDRLRRRRVEHLVVGTGRVDLAAALDALADRYRVRAVRVDAGGTLNAQLVQAGLVDEVSVIVAPHLAAAGPPPVRLLDADSVADGQRLALVEVQRLRDDHVLLRYASMRATRPAAGPGRSAGVVGGPP